MSSPSGPSTPPNSSGIAMVEIPNFGWKRVENLKNEASQEDKTSQVASFAFINDKQQKVDFNSERRLMIILLGKDELINPASEFLQQISGMPAVSTTEIREAAKKENGVTNQLLELMKNNDFKTYPSCFPIGMATERVSKSDHTAGMIFKGFPKIIEQIDVFLNTYTRPNDEVIAYVFDSERKDNEVIEQTLKRLEENIELLSGETRKRGQVIRIDSSDPSIINPRISEVFNQRMTELANKSGKSSISVVTFVAALVAVAGISLFAGKQLFAQGKE